MTINGLIGLSNAITALGLVALGLGLIWMTRGRLKEWPVSARVALGGAFLAMGVCWGQLTMFRHIDLPDPADRNGVGTLVLRLATTVVVVALARRVYAGTLLTAKDREGP
jgi:hypothetical protein